MLRYLQVPKYHQHHCKFKKWYSSVMALLAKITAKSKKKTRQSSKADVSDFKIEFTKMFLVSGKNSNPCWNAQEEWLKYTCPSHSTQNVIWFFLLVLLFIRYWFDIIVLVRLLLSVFALWKLRLPEKYLSQRRVI